MSARPPIVFFRQLRDLGTMLVSDPTFNLDSKHWEYLIDATAQDVSGTLPPATGSKHMVRPLKVDSSDHIINIIAFGSDKIHESGSLVLVGQWSDAWLIDAAPGFWDNTGSTRQGVPPGGTAGQILTKQSDTNNDVFWQDPPSGVFIPLTSRPTSFNDFLAKGDIAGWWP